MIKQQFEKLLWNTRFIVLFAVILSIISSITLFILGSKDIVKATILYNPILNNEIKDNTDILFTIISSIQKQMLRIYQQVFFLVLVLI